MTVRPTMSTLRFLLALLVCVGLLAAACGSDSEDSSESSGAGDGEATEEATEEPTEAATEEPTEAPTEEATEEATEEPTEVELTDSAPGVTAEVIKIGVPVVDTEAIGQNPTHDAMTIWQAAADKINADGGVLGRDIELHMVLADPTGGVSEEQACVALVEDEVVFAALGVFNNDAVLCYTDIGETIAIDTLGNSPEQYERARAPYIGVQPLPDRAAAVQAAALIESGLLDGKKVALSTTAGEEGLIAADAWEEQLAEAGIEVVAVGQWTAPSSDQPAIDAEFDILIESWRANDADTVLAVGTAGVPTTGALTRNGFDVFYIVTHPAATDVNLMESFGYGVDSLEGAVAVVPPSEADMYEADIAGVRQCVDDFDAAYDDDDPVEIRPESADADVIGVIVRSCQALGLFKLVAELAGADLTQESFDAAADELGETTEVVGVIRGSLGPDKRDFVDSGAAVHEYDPELRRFVLSN